MQRRPRPQTKRNRANVTCYGTSRRQEIYEDSVAYLKDKTTYGKIIVFIYDAPSSVREHATTTTALLGIDGVADVVIASRPSQLPPP